VIDELIRGRRQYFIVTLLDPKGSYPRESIRLESALYVAAPEFRYTVTRAEPPNEFGFSEISWANLGELRFWAAMAFAIPEGQGFYYFCPARSAHLCASKLEESQAHRMAERLATEARVGTSTGHWVFPDVAEVAELYAALLQADQVILRGATCYLKSHLFWGTLFMEEMCINLHISLEAGLTVLRKRLSETHGMPVSYDDVYDFIERHFTYGGALVEFWRDRRDDRNLLLHPDSFLGPYAIAPMRADDVYELLGPVLSLYRFLLIGANRPSFD
jgi:hypothetical protein